MAEYHTLIGVTGATIILIAFLLNQSGKINTESQMYDSLNALGALILLLYAFLLDSYPFMVLNFVWLVFSVKDIVKKKNPIDNEVLKSD